jgi:hypothetical protein
MNKIEKLKNITKKEAILIAFDLWVLRYYQNLKWYETFDLIRNALAESNYKIDYDNKNKDIILTNNNTIGVLSIRKYIGYEKTGEMLK